MGGRTTWPCLTLTTRVQELVCPSPNMRKEMSLHLIMFHAWLLKYFPRGTADWFCTLCDCHRKQTHQNHHSFANVNKNSKRTVKFGKVGNVSDLNWVFCNDSVWHVFSVFCKVFSYFWLWLFVCNWQSQNPQPHQVQLNGWFQKIIVCIIHDVCRQANLLIHIADCKSAIELWKSAGEVLQCIALNFFGMKTHIFATSSTNFAAVNDFLAVMLGPVKILCSVAIYNDDEALQEASGHLPSTNNVQSPFDTLSISPQWHRCWLFMCRITDINQWWLLHQFQLKMVTANGFRKCCSQNLLLLSRPTCKSEFLSQCWSKCLAQREMHPQDTLCPQVHFFALGPVWWHCWHWSTCWLWWLVHKFLVL